MSHHHLLNTVHREPMTTAESLVIVVFLIVCGICLMGGNPSPTPTPRLVGYGCEGSNGPLYADEEDYFPRCESIERMELS